MVKVVIFDVGGTLIRSPWINQRMLDCSCQAGLLPAGVVQAPVVWPLFAELGYDLNLLATPAEEMAVYEHVVQELHNRYGCGREGIAPLAPADLAATAATVARQVMTWHDHTELQPDALPVLDALRQTGVPLGVLSNWPSMLRDLLHRFHLTEYFHNIVISSEVSCVKPDPRIFHLAAAQFGVSPGDCLYVGDFWDVDIAGATAAGMQAYWVRRWPDDRTYAGPQGDTLHGLLPLTLPAAG